MLKRYSRVLAAVFSLCVLTSTAVLAQTPTGQISGRVTDASGAVLPGVVTRGRRRVEHQHSPDASLPNRRGFGQ